MLRRCFPLLPVIQAAFSKRLYSKTFTTFFRVSLFIRNFAFIKECKYKKYQIIHIHLKYEQSVKTQ